MAHRSVRWESNLEAYCSETKEDSFGIQPHAGEETMLPGPEAI